jgi:hypothetical protein
MSASFQVGHALLIGAGADLPFTIDDAIGIADILKDPERCAYPPGQVELLVGEAAHRQAVLDALDRLAEMADESSTVIIYFSGHGYHASTSIGEAYFLIPFGVQVERLKDTAISGTEFAARLQAIRSKKILLLLDCCHAGGLGLSKGLELAKSPLPAEALQILEAGKGRVIIASCKDSELSYGGKPYSAFTLALIEAFCGEGASKQDGFVRASDLAMYAREKVPGRTNERQHPILHFEEADNFVLAYYAAGEMEPKGLPFDQEPEIEPEPGAWSGVFDQRGQIVHGPQTNITGNVQGPVLSGSFSGPVSIGETTKRELGRNHKESKALLTARFKKQENEIVIVEIKNIGQAIATNIRISFASRVKAHVCEAKSAPIPNSTNLPAGECILIPIDSSGWKEINVDMRWTDDSSEDNINKSHILLEPI